MAMFTDKQAKLFGKALRAVREAAVWASGKGIKAIGSTKGQHAIKQTAGKLYRIYKKESFAAALKKAPGVAADVSWKTVFAKPTLKFEERYAKYKGGIEARHGVDPANWPAHVKLKTMKEWAADKVPGVHYTGNLPEFDKMGGYLGQKASAALWKKIAKGSAFAGVGAVGISGFAGDKSRAEGYVEGPGGIRVEGHHKFMAAHNPSGRGGHWAAGGGIKTPHGIGGSVGWNVGIGHAEKAGLAHQAGGHIAIVTPFFKTGLSGEEQHTFGIKSRSRRVAAIRRATFGTEQHLGAGKKLSKNQRSRDTLYH